MSADTDGLGYFGKIPALGDFVSRRLPRSFIDPWDKWLQSAVRSSQEMLGDDWLSLFLVSPVWRFALSPGVCSSMAWAGGIMPSVDRVGRYYPLTLAQNVDPECLSLLFMPDSDWFEQLENLALSVLNEEFEFESFDHQAMSIKVADHLKPLRFEAQIPQGINGGLPGKQVYRYDMENLNQIASLFPNLTQNLVEKLYASYSFWAARDNRLNQSRFLCCEGMPPIDAYVGFLQGLPQHSDWDVKAYKLNDYGQQVEPVCVTTPPQQIFAAKQSSEIDIQKLLEDQGFPPEEAEFVFQKQDLFSQQTDFNSPKSPSAHQEFVFAGNEAGLNSPSAIRGWVSHGVTVVGNKRKHNEDAMLDSPHTGIWAVADGMGGHKSGDVASRLIVDSLSNIELTESIETQTEWVCSRLNRINTELCQFAAGIEQGCVVGSTVVVLLAKGSECTVVWAGDSRLYRFRQGKLNQVTRDHTLADEIMDAAMLTREEALQQVGANVITRAVGGHDSLDLEGIQFSAETGDRYLLCSDGLDKELSEIEISAIIQDGDCRTVAESLINQALNKNGRDNITVVVAEFR